MGQMEKSGREDSNLESREKRGKVIRRVGNQNARKELVSGYWGLGRPNQVGSLAALIFVVSFLFSILQGAQLHLFPCSSILWL